MSNASDPFSILNKNRGDLRMPQIQKKQEIKVYRKGKIPENINEYGQNVSEDEDDIFPEAKSFSSLNSEKINNRLQQIESLIQEEENEGQKIETVQKAIQRRRQVQQSQIIQENPEFKKPMERKNIQNQEQEVKITNRAQLRAKLLEQQKQNEKIEEKIQPKEESSQSEEQEDENSEEEDDEEEDKDEDEDENEKKVMMKPVYIPKNERKQNNQIIEEELALQKEKEKIHEMKKNETKQLVIEAIRKDEQNDDNNNDNKSLIGIELPNDNDNINPSYEYEQWKIRELKRIRKTREDQKKERR
ncbi:hypothetical protein IMG5_182060 [Ichthyophthirius multifiliis]|uniref:Micro-fibrillar-associated protein 1 C-terminal domain-containing protein n=1 Tax=Ichthyophthirius multifiliis TaxID=5932 RepID=G0R2Z9_ICHMU|nr:hypothetical protein IMG5_182060 [Ichthyophthirius multifiliis]EGR28159.1 hypothetical protein IMG5_182060 [Ichthyophthirius multifiliis]|eukprot:XP_004027504.1 hypothetical protein IMG5_182060 [Ichthyophthirius multifiliis]